MELSIVLVILGLLTGGILTGQSLIRAAELRSVTTEFEQYQTAVMTFKEKYFALPGDMTNATQFWGRADNGTFAGQCADPVNNQGTGMQTCNGDGNGKVAEYVDVSWISPNQSEAYRFWQHLANAGLINGTFSGVTGPNSVWHGVIDFNSPRSRFGNAGWAMESTWDGSSSMFAGSYGNYFEIGIETNAGCIEGDAFTPEDSWNIDKKMDDGLPAQGKIKSLRWDNCTNAADENDINADYDLQNSDISCVITFIEAF